MCRLRSLGALPLALLLALSVGTPNRAMADGLAAETLMTGTAASQLVDAEGREADPARPPRVALAPLPSTVAMGLLGLTVCAAGVCRRRRRLGRNCRP